jgi:hypothetical protein
MMAAALIQLTLWFVASLSSRGAGGLMIVRAERPSSIVRPEPDSAKKKLATSIGDIGRPLQRGAGRRCGSVCRRSARWRRAPRARVR